MKIKNKSIGIWGYGRVGKAAATFLSKHGARLIVYDVNPLALQGIPFEAVLSTEELFQKTDAIIPSPGIDTNPYRTLYSGIWMNELDLFQSFFQKKIIAITGSIGKTSITHHLTGALQAAGWRVAAGGNIGIPMLSLIEKTDELDAVVLEVSSFQLEHTQSFSPDLAIWTNLYPNHLDRHGTMERYFLAKYHLLKYQNNHQYALVPAPLQEELEKYNPQGTLTFFDPNENPRYPLSGFAQNWLIIEKALSLLEVPFPSTYIPDQLAHRLEHVAIINGVTFINDSKSTTPTSSIAALQSLSSPQTLLLLGGLSKGLDRSEIVKAAHGKVKHVYCFGAEANHLFNLCTQYDIPSTHYQTLSDAMKSCLQQTEKNDTVLLSPAGSSFDEFAHFEERGNVFKEIVLAYKKQFD